MGYIIKLHRQTNNQKPSMNTLLTILATRINEDDKKKAKTIADQIAKKIIKHHPSTINAPQIQFFLWQEKGERTQSPFRLIKCSAPKTKDYDNFFILDLIHEELQDKIKNKIKHKYPLRYHARLHYSTPFLMKPYYKDFNWYSQSFEEAQEQAIGLADHHILNINSFYKTENKFNNKFPIRNLKWEEQWTEDRQFQTNGTPIHDYVLIGEMPWGNNELIVSKFRLELKCLEERTQPTEASLDDSIPQEQVDNPA